MPSAHLCCFRKASEPPRILVVGLQGSGKSLLVQQLLAAAAAWQPQQRSPGCCPGRRSAAVAPLPAESVSPPALASAPKMLPTIGTELHKFPGGIIVREVGGVMQQLWHHYYAESTAVVFVVDAACPEPAAASKHSTPCSCSTADGQQAPTAAGDAAAAATAADGAADAAAATGAEAGAAEVAAADVTAGEAMQTASTAAEEVPSSLLNAIPDSSVSVPTVQPLPPQQSTDTEVAAAIPPDAEAAESAAAAVPPGCSSEAPAPSASAHCACDSSSAGTGPASAPGGFQPSKRAAAPLSEVLLGLLKHSDVRDKPVCVVFNKSDLLPNTQEKANRALLQDLQLQQWKLIDTSAVTGAGLHTLLSWLMCEACVLA